MIVMLLGILLLSPLSGKSNSVIASSVLAAPGPYTLYLPLVMRNFPLRTIFGAEMDQLISSKGLDQMNVAQISWARRNAALWSSVESAKGTYDWSAMGGLESELMNAASKGIQVILIVRSTPQWARKIAGSGPYCGPISQSELPAFGSFMRALVARYSVPPYNVKYWELWNEPDAPFVSSDIGFGCWGDQNDAHYGGGYYAEMLKAAYPQIKAADPQSQVLVGGLLLDCDPRPGAGCDAIGHSNLPGKFLEGILLGGGGPYFDGVSFHAYDYYQGQPGTYFNPNWQSAWNTTGPTVIAKTGFIKSVLSANGFPDKFLMNTETAVLCDTCNNDANYEITKAYFVTQVYAAALAQGLRANIWFIVLGWQTDLINADLSPRPAYTAFQFARSELRDATWRRNVTEYAGVKGYEFLRGDRRIWILWSLDGGTHLISLPSVPLAAGDALGNSISPSSSMNVSLNPLYLEWNP
jgi:hypothetical protein